MGDAEDMCVEWVEDDARREEGMVDVGGRRGSEPVDVYGASRTPGTLFDLRRTLIGPRGDLLSLPV